MSSGVGYGYDPARIVALRHRTHEAIDSLRSIRCDDPLAADAVRVVRLLCQNLEDSWLPLVEAIHSSTAMVAWRRDVGLDDGDIAVGRVGRHLDLVSRWIGSAGLEELTDEQLIERLDTVTGRFARSLQGDGDVTASWAYLDRVLGELGSRLAADDDRVLARRLADRVGTSGVADLVRALDAAGQVVDRDLLVHDGVSTAQFDRLGGQTAVVLGAIAAVDRHARDELVLQVTSSSHLAPVIARHVGAFDPMTVITIVRDLAGYVTGTGSWSGQVRVVDRSGQLGSLLTALAGSPPHALALLADEDTATAVFTARHLDDDATEAVLAAALSAPLLDVEFTPGAMAVWTSLVRTAAEHEVNLGTRRGAALAWGGLAPVLGPHLDARLPVDVVVASRDDAPHVVHLGTYEQLAVLVGQVVDDEAAQLTLGLTIGRYRARQVDLATDAIRAGDGDVADARAQVAAALADVSRMIHLVEHAVDRRNDLHQFRHGLARSRAASVVTALGSVVSWYAPGAPTTGRIVSLTSRFVVDLVGDSEPGAVPDTGLDAHLAVDFVAIVIGLPTRSVDLRSRLGLDGVPEAVWSELDELLDRLDETEDPDEQSRIRSRIRHLVDAHPDLDTYFESVASASGDSALSRP